MLELQKKIPNIIYMLAFLVTTVFVCSCSSDSPSSSSTTKMEIKGVSISGVSQKGPFLRGSTVRIYELNKETLAQTGRTFVGKINNDNGEFLISNVEMESPYAIVEVDGYYRNEVTGKKSSSPLILNAIVDLTDRSTVNVNLLTQMEYIRVMTLTGMVPFCGSSCQEGTGGSGVEYLQYSFAEAKSIAEENVLGSFGVNKNRIQVNKGEDLNIFGRNEGAAILLAISVLMQGDLNEAELTERLDIFSNILMNQASSVWQNSDVALWAFKQTVEGNLEKIRNNISDWSISNEIPDFEKYVKRFWWNYYGLGICDREREGEVLKYFEDEMNVYSELYRYLLSDEMYTYMGEGWFVCNTDPIKCLENPRSDELYFKCKTVKSDPDKKLVDPEECVNVERSEQLYFVCESGDWKYFFASGGEYSSCRNRDYAYINSVAYDAEPQNIMGEIRNIKEQYEFIRDNYNLSLTQICKDPVGL